MIRLFVFGWLGWVFVDELRGERRRRRRLDWGAGYLEGWEHSRRYHGRLWQSVGAAGPRPLKVVKP